MATRVHVVILFWLFAVARSLPAPRAHPEGFGTAKYVLVIGCDGLGKLSCLRVHVHVQP